MVMKKIEKLQQEITDNHQKIQALRKKRNLEVGILAAKANITHLDDKTLLTKFMKISTDLKNYDLSQTN